MLLLYRGEEFDANFFYHSKMDIDHSFFLSDGGKRTLIVSRMNESLARASFGGRVVVYGDGEDSLRPLLRGKLVEVDGASLSMRLAGRLKKFCRTKDNSQELLMMRAEKKPEEAACVRKAAKCTHEIFDSIDFKAAKTELDIKKQLLMKTMEMGLSPAFDPIVATDRNSSFPHYRGGKKRLGSLVLVDYGVRYGHYCSDVTRTFILDGDRKKKEQYERLEGICHFIADSLPDMEKAREAAALAKDLLDKAGFPPMPHALGHGVGLEIHEYPRLGLKSDDSLARATLAIEPSFYLGRYGMRFEETVWFDGKKARVL